MMKAINCCDSKCTVLPVFTDVVILHCFKEVINCKRQTKYKALNITLETTVFPSYFRARNGSILLLSWQLLNSFKVNSTNFLLLLLTAGFAFHVQK